MKSAINWIVIIFLTLTACSSGFLKSHKLADGYFSKAQKLYKANKYHEAGQWFEKASKMEENSSNPRFERLSLMLNNASYSYYKTEEYATAEQLYLRAVALDKFLSPEHPFLASSLNNLAKLYHVQKRYSEAEPLYKHALSIRQKALGQEHPYAQSTLHNLVSLYLVQGRFLEIENLTRRFPKTRGMKLNGLLDESLNSEAYEQLMVLKTLGITPSPELTKHLLKREIIQKEKEISELMSKITYRETTIKCLDSLSTLGDLPFSDSLEYNLEIYRHPTIDAPNQVGVGQELAVQISLTEDLTQNDGKLGKGNVAKAKTMLKEELWQIDVILSAPNFIFTRGSNIGRITFTRNGEAIPATFHLKPRQIANTTTTQTQKIHATLWLRTQFLGSVEHQISVIDSLVEPFLSSMDSSVVKDLTFLKQGFSINLPKQIITGTDLTSIPDLSLYIIEKNNGTSILQISSPHILSKHYERDFFISEEFKDWLNSQYANIANNVFRNVGVNNQKPTNPSNFNRNHPFLLKGLGRTLYEKYAPNPFKAVFWKLVDELGVEFKSIQIITNNPILPWALMVPSRTDGSDERDFLGIDFRIGKLPSSEAGEILNKPPQTLSMKELVVMAPEYPGTRTLPAQKLELATLKTVPGYRRVHGDLKSLKKLFEFLPEGVIHFAGHGKVTTSPSGISEYKIWLDDNHLDVTEFKGLIPSKKNSNYPFLFFNACEVGQANKIANFVDGWGPAVLEAGASAYLGALWPVDDKGAAEFAINFYRILEKHLHMEGVVKLADVLRETRRLYHQKGDPTFLSYVYFGDPNLQVSREPYEKDYTNK